ncbi:MAG: serine hydrolase domain-containing protein [Caldilineaceae bacterium]
MHSALQQLETDIHELSATRRIAGLAIGIIQANTLAYANAFGVQNIETGAPLTRRSLFSTCSVSKTIVGTAIMQLIEQGKVQLSVPVVHYIPYFKLDDRRDKEITIQQMLTHVSGMRSEEHASEFAWDNPEYDDEALERHVRSLAKHKLVSAPGERFAYCNFAFNVLAEVIAKVSGLLFEQYVRAQIFSPLQMPMSTMLFNDVDVRYRAEPHLGEELTTLHSVYPYNRPHAACASLISNINELCRWALVHLNRGELDGVRILRPESYPIMWQPYVQSSATEHRGLGWVHFNHNGTPAIGHDSWDTGFGATFWLFPAQRAAAIVLSNKDFGLFDLYALAGRVSDIALGIE